jgi:hypothetical protein
MWSFFFTSFKMYVPTLQYWILILLGGAVAHWLRHYATSWKVAGSRPDEVN